MDWSWATLRFGWLDLPLKRLKLLCNKEYYQFALLQYHPTLSLAYLFYQHSVSACDCAVKCFLFFLWLRRTRCNKSSWIMRIFMLAMTLFFKQTAYLHRSSSLRRLSKSITLLVSILRSLTHLNRCLWTYLQTLKEKSKHLNSRQQQLECVFKIIILTQIYY